MLICQISRFEAFPNEMVARDVGSHRSKVGIRTTAEAAWLTSWNDIGDIGS